MPVEDKKLSIILKTRNILVFIVILIALFSYLILPFYQRKKDDAYWQKAVSAKNLSICDEIKDEFTRFSCYSFIAGSKQDPSICEKIPSKRGGFSQKDSCYSVIAKITEDPTICDRIENQPEKDKCYSDVK